MAVEITLLQMTKQKKKKKTGGNGFFSWRPSQKGDKHLSIDVLIASPQKSDKTNPTSS